MNSRLAFAMSLILTLICLTMPTAMADDKVDATGDWEMVVNTPDGGSLNLQVSLKQDGDKVTGTLKGDDGEETEIQDGAIKDGELTFKIARDFGGQELKSSFKGKLDADGFEGSVDFELGSEVGTLPVVGTRAGANTIAGDWKLSINTPDGQTLQPVLSVKQDGDNYSGKLTGDDGRESEVKEVSFKDGELAFTLEGDFGGTPLVSKFKCKLEGKELSGTVDYELGGEQGTLDVTGERAAPEIDLNGTWLLVATSEGGTFEPKAHLKHEGDAVTGKYEWSEETQAEIEDGKLVDGELTFTVKHDFNGQEIVVKYKVKPEGDKLAGTADYDLGGQLGVADIEGSRSKGADVAGTWNIAIDGENGEKIESTVKLTQDGDTIGGEYSGPAGDAKVTDAKLDGNKLTFSVERERDGRKLVVNYSGEIEGDTLAGDVEIDIDGQTRSTKFEAKRAE
jgi:hypothetical protein